MQTGGVFRNDPPHSGGYTSIHRVAADILCIHRIAADILSIHRMSSAMRWTKSCIHRVVADILCIHRVAADILCIHRVAADILCCFQYVRRYAVDGNYTPLSMSRFSPSIFTSMPAQQS